jgi:initiation factor 1A|uniref:S1-like domain-containing protein n=1 Tax=viral metagenome TaxID=1070528 RepID=A0A6C0C5W2_9ZZZZ
MVKNTKGGNRHKKMASKNFKQQRTHKLRKIREDGEDYAMVIKNSGGGHCVVKCNSDGKERTCVIRGKFKGRNKRSNQIIEGGLVLIGLRDWEVVKPGKLEKCDLLEVYSRDQCSELKEVKGMNLIIDNDEENHDNIEFTNEEDMEDYVAENMKVSSSANSNLKTDLEETEFDWDDI